MVSPSASPRFVVPGLRRRFATPALLRRRLGAFAVLAGLLLLPLTGALAEEPGGIVDVVEVDGVVDRTMANYVVDVIEKANADGAEVVVVELDSPGALGDAAERVIEAMAASEVPIVVWVGPPGAWAVGGGMAIAQAAELFAVAPGTLLGPAESFDLAVHAGGDVDERLTALARAQGREADLIASFADGVVIAVAPPGDFEATLPEDARLPDGVARDDVSVISGTELAEVGVIDLTAESLPALLTSLEGREVGAATLDVDTASANVRFNNLGLIRQVLHALTAPMLVYLLIVAGALALLFEVFQPGFGVAGASGLALLALAAYGLVVLPTSLFGLLLLVVGFLLLAADLALGRLGLLTGLGALGFVVGSVMLFTGPPQLAIPFWLVGVATVANLVFFVGVMTTVLRAQGNQALAGAEHLVGETGVVRSMLNPEGHIFVGNALWRARAPEDVGKVKTGTSVRVIGLNDRLTLDVVPLDADADERAEKSSSVS